MDSDMDEVDDQAMHFSWAYFPLVAISATWFYVIVAKISPALSATVCDTYRQLSRAQKMEWDSRVSSTVHAIVTSSVSLYLILFDECLHDDPESCGSVAARGVVAIFLGYSVIDVIMILANRDVFSDMGFVYHHLAAIWAYFYVVAYGVFPWYAVFRLLAELSTPNVNMRWFLDVLNYGRTSRVYVINGLAMVAIFFGCRVAVIPAYWRCVLAQYSRGRWTQFGHSQYVLLVSCFVLDVLNVVWCRKMLAGAKKLLVAKVEGSEAAAKSVKID